MTFKIGFIHATPNAFKPIADAMCEHAPDVEYVNFLDEELLNEVNRTGKVTMKLVRRLIRLIEGAEDCKVDGVALSCSSFTPYIHLVEPLFDFPIVSVDYAMLDQAVTIGNKIGIIATIAAAGPTSTNIIKDIAKVRNKPVVVYTETILEATEALKKGDTAKHDELIQQKINELSRVCDVIVIAQLSMVRALNNMRTVSVPLLTSGETSIKSLLSKLSATEITR